MQNDPAEWFLGSVDFDATQERFTRLHPIALISAEGSRWEMLGNTTMTRFPTRGLVCWFEAPVGIRKHMLVEFQAVANPRFDPKKGPDELQVRKHRPPIEVVSLEGSTERQLRDALKGEGVPLGRHHVGRCLFKVSGERLFGPFDVVAREPGHWGLPNETDWEAIPMFRAQPASATAVSIDGKQRMMLVQTGPALTAPRFANWQSDADVLRGVLKRLHKLDVERFRTLNVTYNVFDSYIAAVADADLLPDRQLAKEQARVERLKELRADLPLAAALVEEMVTKLETFGSVKQRIDERVAAAAAERKAEIDGQVAADLAKLEELQRDVASARAKLARLEKEIAARTQSLASDLLTADEAMREKVHEIRAAPVRAAVEALAGSAFLPALLQGHPVAEFGRPMLNFGLEGSGVVVSEPALVLDALSRQFRDAGIALDSNFPVVAALAAGLIPICAGDAAGAALRAVGRCLFGGSAWWFPVSPIATSLHDIFAPAGAGMQPAIGGLCDIVEAARQNSETLVLAVLEGIDLAASEGFLLPLISIADCGSVATGYRVPMCEWPPNLLLAMTTANARTALPLPRRVWEFAPLFNLDWAKTLELAEGGTAPLSRIAALRWQEIRAAAERVAPTGGVIPSDLSPPARKLGARLARAAIALGAASEDAWAIAATHVLVPALASAGAPLPAELSSVAPRNFEIANALISDQPSEH